VNGSKKLLYLIGGSRLIPGRFTDAGVPPFDSFGFIAHALCPPGALRRKILVEPLSPASSRRTCCRNYRVYSSLLSVRKNELQYTLATVCTNLDLQGDCTLSHHCWYAPVA